MIENLNLSNHWRIAVINLTSIKLIVSYSLEERLTAENKILKHLPLFALIAGAQAQVRTRPTVVPVVNRITSLRGSEKNPSKRLKFRLLSLPFEKLVFVRLSDGCKGIWEQEPAVNLLPAPLGPAEFCSAKIERICYLL